MGALEAYGYLRSCTDTDDAFVYDVFATTWESQVAALPNPNLAQHVLRIQHIAQERRFAARFPGQERYIIVEHGEPAGRLYVQDTGSVLHVVDLTLLPRFRSRGIGSRVVRDLCAYADLHQRTVSLRVGRPNDQATGLYASHGFNLVAVDDLDNYFEWVPPSVKEAAVKEGPSAVKEAGVKESSHSLP